MASSFWKSVCLTFVLISLAAPTLAAGPQPLFNTPVYDPVSKKYYALIDARSPGSPYPRNEGLNWELAYNEAKTRTYKGVQGRLAVVDSAEVHEFLLRTFHSDVEAWIGLRYWCSRHKLQWSDGSYLLNGSFSAWDRNWNQDVGSCKSEISAHPKGAEQFMPVAYNGPTKGPFRWIGKGWDKRYVEYFIEFPTGQP